MSQRRNVRFAHCPACGGAHQGFPSACANRTRGLDGICLKSARFVQKNRTGVSELLRIRYKRTVLRCGEQNISASRCRLATFWRKSEGLSIVFSSASQWAVCEVEQIRLSPPSPNIGQSQCFDGSGPLPTRVYALVGRLKPCASRLRGGHATYENTGDRPSFLRRKVASKCRANVE